MKFPIRFTQPAQSAAPTPASTTHDAQRGPACGETGAASGRLQEAGGTPASGLVKISTSATSYRDFIEIDPKKTRVQRLRKTIPPAANLLQQALGPKRYKAAMVTLTYRGVDDFEPKHISRFLDLARKWMARRGYKLHYVWVAELQKRGALHYHVLIWLPKGLTLPKPDKQGWWPHGMSKIEWARNAVGYMVKYLSKMDSEGSFPKGCRLSGRGGLDASARSICRWINYSSWLKRIAGVNTPIKRIKGLGLVNMASGEVLRSPWQVIVAGGKIIVYQVFELVGGVDYHGPYSMLKESHA